MISYTLSGYNWSVTKFAYKIQYSLTLYLRNSMNQQLQLVDRLAVLWFATGVDYTEMMTALLRPLQREDTVSGE